MDIEGYISELSKYPNRNAELSLVCKRILRHFGENDCLSTYQVYKYLKTTEHAIAYKNVHKRVHKLRSLDLIKEVKSSQVSKHAAIYYRLTTGGIFRLIYESKGYPFFDQKKLLEYYGDNIIFKTFIYPYIERKTLLQLQPFVFFAIYLFSYVDECCRITEKNQYKDPNYMGLDDSSPVYEIFHWNDLQGDDIDRLMSFLFLANVKWFDHSAKIENFDNGTTIKVSEKEHFLFIRLNDRKTKAIMSIDDGRTHEFDVRVLKKRTVIKFPHMTFKQLIAKDILRETQLRIPTMLFSLLRMSLDFAVQADLIRPILEDKTFMKSAQIAEEEFGRSYMNFVELRNKSVNK